MLPPGWCTWSSTGRCRWPGIAPNAAWNGHNRHTHGHSIRPYGPDRLPARPRRRVCDNHRRVDRRRVDRHGDRLRYRLAADILRQMGARILARLHRGVPGNAVSRAAFRAVLRWAFAWAFA